jgi:hypothetical protein
MVTKELLTNLPRKSEMVSHESGVEVEKGKFRYWYDTSIDRDIFDVDAYELMEALKVDTLDDLFKVIKERFHFDSFRCFLDDNGINYGYYAH